ncbi:hypothetical protein [Desulfosporosinus sp. BICA1-9]|nr:hypothetical protein [Desulfosporosinus sp. BICA1-9]
MRNGLQCGDKLVRLSSWRRTNLERPVRVLATGTLGQSTLQEYA